MSNYLSIKLRSDRFFYITRLGFSLVCLLLISSCSMERETPLRIGTNVWPGYEPLYLARSLGYFDESSIHLVELTSASDVLHALRNGTLEGGALTMDEALSLLDSGIDMKIILVMDLSEGGDVLLVKPEIDALDKLRGKKVAVEYSAVGAILLDGALQSAGLNASDITIIACALNEHISCYQNYDAVVTFEPVRTKLLKQGALQLFDSSMIRGRIVDVLAVNSELVKTHPYSLRKLLAGYFKARNYFDGNPERAAQLMSVRMQLTPAEVLDSYDGLRLPDLEENRRLLGGQPSPLQNTASKVSKFMLQRKLLKHQISVENLIDDSFLPESKIK